MRTIKEALKIDVGLIMESVFEPHIKMIIDQFRRAGVSTKTLYQSLPIQLDKIDSSNVDVLYNDGNGNFMDDIDKAMKKSVVILVKDDIACVLWYPPAMSLKSIKYDWLPTSKNDSEDIKTNPIRNKFKYLSSWSRSSRTTKLDFLDMAREADEAWVIDPQKFNTTTIQKARETAKSGVWDNSPEFYAKWLKNNLERYAREIAKIRAERGDSFKIEFDKAQALVKNILNLLEEYNANTAIGKWGSDKDISRIIYDLLNYPSNIFRHINEVIDLKKEIEKIKDKAANTTDIKKRKYLEDSIGYSASNYEDYLDYLRRGVREGTELYKKCIEMIKNFE